jgi:hypothetical protein
MMQINAEQPYFLMSFRFDRKGLGEFDLVASPPGDDLFLSKSDGSIWKKKCLYDFGWGNENGFVRQPELDFDELWYLLWNGERQENVYGAAAEMSEQYPEQLLVKVEALFNQDTSTGDNERVKKILLILKLDQPVNRSSTAGKPYQQVETDSKRWRAISEKVSALTQKQRL